MKPKSIWIPVAVALGAVSLLASGWVASSTANPTVVASPQRAVAGAAVAAALQETYVSVFKLVSPSVVQIETAEGLGSGIVFDRRGNIVTNNHVVGTAKTFPVPPSNGKRLKATLVGTFPADDL